MKDEKSKHFNLNHNRNQVSEMARIKADQKKKIVYRAHVCWGRFDLMRWGSVSEKRINKQNKRCVNQVEIESKTAKPYWRMNCEWHKQMTTIAASRHKNIHYPCVSSIHCWCSRSHLFSSYGRWLFLAKLKSWDGSCLHTSRYEII